MRNQRPALTFGQTMRRRFVSTLTCCGLLAGSFAVSYPLARAIIPTQATFVEHEQQAPVQPLTPRESEAAMWADLLGCWEATAPADMDGKIPTQVILVRRGVVVNDPALVAKALEQALTDTDHGLRIVAFCR